MMYLFQDGLPFGAAQEPPDSIVPILQTHILLLQYAESDNFPMHWISSTQMSLSLAASAIHKKISLNATSF